MTRALLVAAIALFLAPVAHAGSASGAQVRSLAQKALHDPAALAALREIDTVDGRPMTLQRVLGVRGATLRARLRTLARPGAVAVNPQAGPEARKILSGRKYRGSSVPRPLHRPLAWLGGKLVWPFHQIGNAVDRLLRWLGIRSSNGKRLVWGILALIVLGAAVAFATRIARSSGGQSVARGAERLMRRGDDPGELEQAAEDAERAGEFERALRLRFRAGLVRLARVRAIPSRASLTTGEARALLESPEFDELALTFEEVAYGGRRARPEDLERARASWPRVLAGAQVK